jgi:hypothetical protein
MANLWPLERAASQVSQSLSLDSCVFAHLPNVRSTRCTRIENPIESAAAEPGILPVCTVKWWRTYRRPRECFLLKFTKATPDFVTWACSTKRRVLLSISMAECT